MEVWKSGGMEEWKNGGPEPDLPLLHSSLLPLFHASIRRHRSDLPGRTTRRQAMSGRRLVGLVALGAAALSAGCGGSEPAGNAPATPPGPARAAAGGGSSAFALRSPAFQ